MPFGAEVKDGKVQWLAAVKARGGVATRMPPRVNGVAQPAAVVGELAARYGSTQPLRYELAPASVRALDREESARWRRDMLAGKVVEVVEQGLKDAASAPRKVVGAVLGLPDNLVVPIALALFVLVAPRLPGLTSWGGDDDRARRNLPRRRSRARRRR